MSNILHLLCSAPDEFVAELISTLTDGREIRVVCLYPDDISQGAIDWDRLVEDIIAHECIISWW
jgi:hypothetical protein